MYACTVRFTFVTGFPSVCIHVNEQVPAAVPVLSLRRCVRPGAIPVCVITIRVFSRYPTPYVCVNEHVVLKTKKTNIKNI